MNLRGNVEDCLGLMQTLIEYRHNKTLHHQLMKAADHSMLSIDVLILIHYFAKVSEGDILEIGSFFGGSTIVAAMGARDSGGRKKFISIEPGDDSKITGSPAMTSSRISRRTWRVSVCWMRLP